MVYGILNLINFAHGDVLMVGALTALSTVVFLQSKFPDAPGLVAHACGLGTAIPTCVIVRPDHRRVAYRPLRNAPPWRRSSPRSAFPIVLQTIAMLVWGATT